AGGLSAMQPDVAPGFPGEPLDSLTDSWTFNSAVAVSTLRKEGYATERTYHQNPKVHNQSLFFSD
ncbi:TPA: hypothetical protein ACNGY7_005933, partial [Klebsiella quasipneumoniae subsp. quasipneumoniae]